jgi:hypothetical protein
LSPNCHGTAVASARHDRFFMINIIHNAAPDGAGEIAFIEKE